MVAYIAHKFDIPAPGVYDTHQSKKWGDIEFQA